MKLPSFQRMPFRRKLTVLIAAATGIALVLVGAAVVVSEYAQMRRGALDEATLQAEIIAENSTAAVDFDMAEEAAEILDAAATIDPADARVPLWRFEAAMADGDLPAALRSVRRARVLGADPIAIVLARARVLEEHRDRNRVIALLSRAAATHGRDERLLDALAAFRP